MKINILWAKNSFRYIMENCITYIVTFIKDGSTKGGGWFHMPSFYTLWRSLTRWINSSVFIGHIYCLIISFE